MSGRRPEPPRKAAGASELPPPDCNAILAALPPSARRHISGYLEPVLLEVGAMLYQVGDTIGHLYFPTSGLISLLVETEEGLSVEIGAVGREGVLGLPLLLGGVQQQHVTIVQQGGTAYRMRAGVLEGADMQVLRTLMLRYASFHMAEISQSAVCSRFHSIRQRMCRWLLAAYTRTGRNRLDFTQEVLSQILGARRPVVTTAASRLQQEGATQYRRGCVTIVNPHRLRHCACECYSILEKHLSAYLNELVVA